MCIYIYIYIPRPPKARAADTIAIRASLRAGQPAACMSLPCSGSDIRRAWAPLPIVWASAH